MSPFAERGNEEDERAGFSFQIHLVDLSSDVCLCLTKQKSFGKSEISAEKSTVQIAKKDFALGSRSWNVFCRL